MNVICKIKNYFKILFYEGTVDSLNFSLDSKRHHNNWVTYKLLFQEDISYAIILFRYFIVEWDGEKSIKSKILAGYN